VVSEEDLDVVNSIIEDLKCTSTSRRRRFLFSISHFFC